jgi:hypothetical protein
MKWLKRYTTDRNEVPSKLIRKKFGAAGYGIYCSLQEVIGENVKNNNLPEWGHVDPLHDLDTLADECSCTVEELQAFLQFCNDKQIITKDNGSLYCAGILERLDEYAEKILRGKDKNRDKIPTQSGVSRKNIPLEEEKKKKKNIYPTAEALELLQNYNRIFRKEQKSTVSWEKNLAEWLNVYSVMDMIRALEIAKKDSFYSDKMTVEMLLRKKNPRGEDCDRIAELLAKEKKPVLNSITPSNLPYSLPNPEEVVTNVRMKQILASKGIKV